MLTGTETLLLEPPAGDPYGLFAPGALGDPIPVVWCVDRRWGRHTYRADDHPRALPLVNGGIPLTELCDRAARVVSRSHLKKTAPLTVYFFNVRGFYTVPEVVQLGKMCEAAGVGRLLTLSAPLWGVNL